MTPPFAIEWIVEGEGTLDSTAWQVALDVVTDAHPFTAVRLRGTGKRLRFHVGGVRPGVRVVDGSGWDGQSSAGVPWGVGELDAKHGPVAEIVLLSGPVPRVVYRALHAVFDGRGVAHWAREIGRALRGEPLEGPADPVDDREAARAVEAPPGQEPANDAAAPWMPNSADLRTSWVRRRVEQPGRQIMPRLMLALAQRVDGLTRISVPVDLRPRLRDAGFSDVDRYTGNLTGIVHLNLDPAADLDTIAGQLRTVVLSPAAAGHALAAHQIRGVPIWLMAKAGTAAARSSLQAQKWPVTAAITNLGLQQPQTLSGAAFVAKRILTVVPSTPGLPLFVSLTGDPDGVEMCASAPHALADMATLSALLEQLL